jgi:hypothetical protein
VADNTSEVCLTWLVFNIFTLGVAHKKINSINLCEAELSVYFGVMHVAPCQPN